MSEAKVTFGPEYNAIMQGKPNEAIIAAIRMSSQNAASNRDAILVLDERFFCQGSTATANERIEAVLTLMRIFVENAEANEDED